MSDVNEYAELRRLLAEADPAPWIRPWASTEIHGAFAPGDLLTRQKNIDLAVAAVNALPGLLDERDRLRSALDTLDEWLMHPDRSYSPHEIAMHVHADLRRALNPEETGDE